MYISKDASALIVIGVAVAGVIVIAQAAVTQSTLLFVLGGLCIIMAANISYFTRKWREGR